jgi:D-alanyl-D-alanine carboxypeptidase
MNRTAAARTPTRRGPGPATIGLALVVAAIVGTLFCLSAPSSVLLLGEALRGDHGRATAEAGRLITEDDGALPDGVTVFDEEYPGVSDLDPDLLDALRRAATDAADDGIEIYVNSGWRSPAYQDQLLREAVAEYGSEEEAARWVATADTSPHVTGDAVDLGPVAATTWLSAHGAAYGLCPVYGNEPWHFELFRQAVDRGCLPPYADPTHDPRMRP